VLRASRDDADLSVVAAFRPHDVEWDPERIERFWNFYVAHSSAEEYFSRKVAPEIVAVIERHVRRVGTVLDIGCGSGDLLAVLQERGHGILGVDSSAVSVGAARDRVGDTTGSRILQGTLADLPIGDGSVDTALLVEVVEHVRDDDLDVMLAEAYRVIRPGGSIFISTPNSEDLGRETVQCPDCGAQFHRMQHIRSWTPATLKDRLEAAGFRTVTVVTTRFPERSAAWLRLLRKAWYRIQQDRRHLYAVAQKP
jgi:2-polyprenyl-3-methyl-5-hydroxy-6-metoxy-1,4-benzoquinol methylase